LIRAAAFRNSLFVVETSYRYTALGFCLGPDFREVQIFFMRHPERVVALSGYKLEISYPD